MDIYLDLDRTLFRTDSATRQIWQQIAQHYPAVDADVEYARGTEFHTTVGDLYYYDFTAHVRACELDAEQIYAMLSASPLADNRFLFDGAAHLVQWAQGHARPAILTFGSDDYQRLKIALCPALVGLPVYTTLAPKAQWFLDKGECWMIDDKAIGGELPANVRFVQVSLEGRNTPEVPWPCFQKLSEVEEYLHDHMH